MRHGHALGRAGAGLDLDQGPAVRAEVGLDRRGDGQGVVEVEALVIGGRRHDGDPRLAGVGDERGQRGSRRPDGGDPHYVASATNTFSISFSPDGSKLAAAFTDYDKSGVILVDLGTRKAKKIVEMKPHMPTGSDWRFTGTGSPRWVVGTFGGVDFSPDGKTLVYCSDQKHTTFNAYTIPVAGGEAKEIASTAFPASVVWRP